MNIYLQFLLSLLIGIAGASITSFINYKNAKAPNRENIAKNLLENFFAPNSEKIELNLYHELDNEIKQKLIDLRNDYKEYLIYFSSDFTTTLRQITEQDDNNLEVYQNKFNSLSSIYIKTLNKTRITLGLPRLSINFRIENELYKNPKIANYFKNTKTILELTCIFSLLFLVISLYFLTNTSWLSMFWLGIAVFSFTILILFLTFLYLFTYKITLY